MSVTTTYQPHLLDPHNAEPQPVSPRNGRSFKLAELYELLDCQTVDVVRLTDELILIIDDEGKFRTPCYLNLLATYLWYQYQPQARGVDSIVGRAILCHDRQFRWAMRKLLAPVCRGLLRPVPGSPLGSATYLLLFRRPGCPHALLLLGQRAECLRAALRETIRDIHHSQDCHEHPTGAADPEEGGEAFYEPPPAWSPEDFYDDTDY